MNDELEPRGLFESIRLIFQSVSDALVVTTRAVARGSEGLDVLARTGLVMAESNERKVMLRTQGKEMKELQRLKEQYPELNIDLEKYAKAK